MKTERGRFRNVEMQEIERWRGHSMWGSPMSVGTYIYPVAIRASIAAKEGARLSSDIGPEGKYRLKHFHCASSPESHFGPWHWAIDFLVPDGTPVVAAADGTVIEIQQHGVRYGDGPKYRDEMNYVTIMHASGEFSQYCHLAFLSVLHESRLELGCHVEKGQRIGLVGKTGWTDRDHLHFGVYHNFPNPSPAQFRSVKPRFVPSTIY